MTKNGSTYRIGGISFELNNEFEITTTKEARQHDHAYFMAKEDGDVCLNVVNVASIGNVRVIENGKPVLLKGQELVEIRNLKNRDELAPLSMVKEATKDAWRWLTANGDGRIPQVELQEAMNSFQGMAAPGR